MDRTCLPVTVVLDGSAKRSLRCGLRDRRARAKVPSRRSDRAISDADTTSGNVRMIESAVIDATQEMANRWLTDGRRVAQALLVSVQGSAPLPEGAMLIVDEDGSVEGSITGGCVEGAVVIEAERLLAGERDPGVLSYGISDELAGTVGLMCGGTVTIVLAELVGEAAQTELAALRAHAEGRPVAIATALDGSPGARLAIVDGRVRGSLAGPALLDHNVARTAAGLLEEGRTSLCRFGADGATLGAELRIHVRAYAPPPKMVVVGAIDFAAAIAPIAVSLGYVVTILDARERFARSGRFTEAAEVRVGWPQELMPEIELGGRDVVLVFTHDPKFDEPALLAALATGSGYIGALGSRNTTADRERRLRARGVDDDGLARIHSPCGLDIGSRTAEETAISVLAEIISVRAQRCAAPLRETSGPIHTRPESW
jgi:xanthine dehydrogenase accessory factor